MTGLGLVNEGETVKPIADPRGREQQPDDPLLHELLALDADRCREMPRHAEDRRQARLDELPRRVPVAGLGADHELTLLLQGQPVVGPHRAGDGGRRSR